MKRNKRGFTLVELLITMTIIGILSTLVVVTSNNAKEKAENKGVINLSEVISSAVNVYYFKNGKYPTIN